MGNERPSVDGGSSAAGPATGDGRYPPAVDGEHAGKGLPLVGYLVADARRELLAGNPVVLPERTPLSTPSPRHEGERRVAESEPEPNGRCDGPPTHRTVEAGHTGGRILTHIGERSDVSAGDQPSPGRRSRLGQPRWGDVDG